MVRQSSGVRRVLESVRNFAKHTRERFSLPPQAWRELGRVDQDNVPDSGAETTPVNAITDLARLMDFTFAHWVTGSAQWVLVRKRRSEVRYWYMTDEEMSDPKKFALALAKIIEEWGA